MGCGRLIIIPHRTVLREEAASKCMPSRRQSVLAGESNTGGFSGESGMGSIAPRGKERLIRDHLRFVDHPRQEREEFIPGLVLLIREVSLGLLAGIQKLRGGS